jgi:hypothetical protein
MRFPASSRHERSQEASSSLHCTVAPRCRTSRDRGAQTSSRKFGVGRVLRREKGWCRRARRRCREHAGAVHRGDRRGASALQSGTLREPDNAKAAGPATSSRSSVDARERTDWVSGLTCALQSGKPRELNKSRAESERCRRAPPSIPTKTLAPRSRERRRARCRAGHAAPSWARRQGLPRAGAGAEARP